MARFAAMAASAAGLLVAAASAASVTFTNTNRFLFDTDGNQIDAYAAKVNLFNTTAGSKYYLYGIGFGTPTLLGGKLKSYSSTDLVNWKYEGELGDVTGGRPHIVYNAATQKYALWVNGNGGYEVATSASPTGPFTLVGSTQPTLSSPSNIAADAAVESFGNQGYLVYSELNFIDPRAGSIWPPIYQTMHISPLTSDFTNVTSTTYPISSAALDAVDQQTESPDIFKRGNTFYVVTSNTCGFCNGTLGVVYRSNSLQGPWKRQIISGDSCGGQVEGVLPLTDPATGQTSYVWHSTTTPGGPESASRATSSSPSSSTPTAASRTSTARPRPSSPSTSPPAPGPPPRARSWVRPTAPPRVANYQAVCDSDIFYGLYQTWTNSKAGTLKEVAVNIAAGNNSNNLEIKVFKFSSVADLVSPGYKYQLLGSKVFAPSDLTQTFGTASVPLSAQVAKGDKLGFSIAETNPIGLEFSIGNFVPYCHLEYPAVSTSTATAMTLLQQGSGQNSFRGPQGNVSPVQPRQGRGIKFFSIVT